MSTDEDLRAARAKIVALEAEATKRGTSDAIRSELSRFEFASDAAREQCRQLLEPSVSVTARPDGKTLLTGPNFVPLGHYVDTAMKDPTYAHFLQSPAPTPPAATSDASPYRPSPAPGVVAFMAPRQVLPGETLGHALAREALEAQAQTSARPQAGADPQRDISLPMALGARSFPHK